MTFEDACRAILDHPKADHYAKAYAAAGLSLPGLSAQQLNPSFQRTQARYILSNLKAWRAPEAKEVRATLRLIGEVK